MTLYLVMAVSHTDIYGSYLFDTRDERDNKALDMAKDYYSDELFENIMDVHNYLSDPDFFEMGHSIVIVMDDIEK